MAERTTMANEELEKQLETIIEEHSLAVTLHVLSNVCGNEALKANAKGEKVLAGAWMDAKDRVYRTFKEQIAKPGY